MFARHLTLVAATPATATLDRDYTVINVVNRDATAEVFFTIGGATPTVGGNNTFLARPGERAAVPDPAVHPAGTTVQLISSGTPAVSVIAY